jgi:DNA-binding CsgD family transcriptional regulator
VYARRAEASEAPIVLADHESVASSREARNSLIDAVGRREWARSRNGRMNPERATRAWKPLVAGRWSLVDRYERDGHRYIVARENSPAATELRELSAREYQVASLASLGHANKLIAYELGLSDSTVRVLSARAAVKLGARTRSQMIERFQLQGRPAATAATRYS